MTSVSLFLYDIYVQNLQDSDGIRCINANLIAFHMYNLYGVVLWDRESCHLTIVISKREFLFFSSYNEGFILVIFVLFPLFASFFPSPFFLNINKKKKIRQKRNKSRFLKDKNENNAQKILGLERKLFLIPSSQFCSILANFNTVLFHDMKVTSCINIIISIWDFHMLNRVNLILLLSFVVQFVVRYLLKFCSFDCLQKSHGHWRQFFVDFHFP